MLLGSSISLTRRQLFRLYHSEKSLRLLVSTAKHIHVPTYETTAEAVFGTWGFRFILINMFVMSYGAMVSYLILVRDSFSMVFEVEEPNHRQLVLVVVSLCVQLPLSCLRDMADLDKTSRIAVLIDILLVAYLIYITPWYDNLQTTGGFFTLLSHDTIHYDTIFIGLGVLSFAFECQESAFLVAGSLKEPTQKRWGYVTAASLTICASLAMACGIAGYVGYFSHTEGNILNNLNPSSVSGRIAHASLGMTMLFVYPLASFVSRHVMVVLLFEGTRAHEGDDTSILNRLDRRISLTIVLYLLAMLPATFFQDMGIVLSLAGTIGGSSLAYIGPGMLYLGVHGGRFMELVNDSWLVLSRRQRRTAEAEENNKNGSLNVSRRSTGSGKGATEPGLPVETTPLLATQEEVDEMVTRNESDAANLKFLQRQQAMIFRFVQTVVWYVTGFPLWCQIALYGKSGLTKHVHALATRTPHPIRIGDVEYTLVPVSISGRIETECEGDAAVVVTQYQRSESLPLPALGKERGVSLEAAAADNKKQMRKSRQKTVALEPDPQEAPPTWMDFFVAIFFIVFGVIALMAGLFSLYATS